jgi:flagellar biogenesis protein FliO
VNTLFAQIGRPPAVYIPPQPAPALDPVQVLFRLVALTLVTLLVCGGVIWWARRAGRVRAAAGNAAGRLKLDGQIPLDGRSTLHVIRVDGHQVVVTTDATGLRSIVPLAERFEAALVEETEGVGVETAGLNPAAHPANAVTS